MESQPLLTFTSHIAGKNARVSIYPDRVEWIKPRGISGGKITAGIMTAGTSLLLTGVKGGNSGTEMIPVKNMSSITTKRDGMLNTVVSVITSGNTVDFRVSHSEAKQVKEVLTSLIMGTHYSQQKQAEPVASQPAEAFAPAVAANTQLPDLMAQITKLAELRDAGVLTEDEFSGKKAELLARM